MLIALTLAAFPLTAAQQPIEPRLRIPRYVESSIGLDTPRWEEGNTELEFGDVNGDGHPDIVSIGDHGSPYLNSTEHGIMVWFGDGTGRWSVVMTGDFGYGGIALGDANGDGWLDVAYGMHHNYAGSDFGDQLLEVALGDGTGRNWQPWDDGLATSGETWGMFECDFADVDNDGDLDVGSLSFGCCNGWHVYLNQGNGTWVQSAAMPGGNANNGFVFGDVNNDGNADLAVAHEAGTVYVGDGAGGFTLADQNLPPPGGLGRPGVDLGDMDGDGRDDLSYIGGGAPKAWLSTTAGWVQVGQGLPASGDFEKTELADMNRDGRMDLVAFGRGEGAVYLGDGTGAFRRAAQFSTPNPGYAAAFRAGTDADHNGYPDIVLVSEEGSLFNTRNSMHFFKERSVPAALAVAVVSPGPGTVLRAGSVRFVDWLAGVPGGVASTADIHLSITGPAGPWFPVAMGLPNSGRYQWPVPAAASADCWIRVTVRTATGAIAARTRAAFEIR